MLLLSGALLTVAGYVFGLAWLALAGLAVFMVGALRVLLAPSAEQTPLFGRRASLRPGKRPDGNPHIAS